MMRYCGAGRVRRSASRAPSPGDRRLSFSPSMIRTGVPSNRTDRSVGKGDSGRNRTAPANSVGSVSNMAAVMIAPLEKPTAMGCCANRWTVRDAVRPAAGSRVIDVGLIDGIVGAPVKKREPAIDLHGAANGQRRRAWREFRRQRHERMFIAAGTVQQDEWRARGVRAGKKRCSPFHSAALMRWRSSVSRSSLWNAPPFRIATSRFCCCNKRTSVDGIAIHQQQIGEETFADLASLVAQPHQFGTITSRANQVLRRACSRDD